MGWKNVRTAYQVKHIVHVRESNVCVGSPYVSEIIRIRNGVPEWASGLGRPKNGDLIRIFDEMEANPNQLRRLIEMPDTFDASIQVFTYDMGDIIEKRCEALGWANVTHDGCLMYENMFSTDRAEVIGWAMRNAVAGTENIKQTIAEVEKQLAERRAILAEYEDAKRKLQALTQEGAT